MDRAEDRLPFGEARSYGFALLQATADPLNGNQMRAVVRRRASPRQLGSGDAPL